ncbi:MAG: glycosyltransferase [Acidobacteriota bacterium]
MLTADPEPCLSIVIPTYNEARGIAETLAQWSASLRTWASTWEVLVADDGSTDATVACVKDAMPEDARIRIIELPHRGKGSAVRQGMLSARGAWRFLADADLSMDVGALQSFFVPSGERGLADVVMGSREAAGARRVGEPWRRHAIGRVFNWLARLVAVPGVQDTQCGFKLFSRQAALSLFPHQTLDGFAYDVEILFLARRAGFSMLELPITWTFRPSSRVRVGTGSRAFADVLRIRWNALAGRYDGLGRHVAV